MNHLAWPADIPPPPPSLAASTPAAGPDQARGPLAKTLALVARTRAGIRALEQRWRELDEGLRSDMRARTLASEQERDLALAALDQAEAADDAAHTAALAAADRAREEALAGVDEELEQTRSVTRKRSTTRPPEEAISAERGRLLAEASERYQRFRERINRRRQQLQELRRGLPQGREVAAVASTLELAGGGLGKRLTAIREAADGLAVELANHTGYWQRLKASTAISILLQVVVAGCAVAVAWVLWDALPHRWVVLALSGGFWAALAILLLVERSVRLAQRRRFLVHFAADITHLERALERCAERVERELDPEQAIAEASERLLEREERIQREREREQAEARATLDHSHRAARARRKAVEEDHRQARQRLEHDRAALRQRRAEERSALGAAHEARLAAQREELEAALESERAHLLERRAGLLTAVHEHCLAARAERPPLPPWTDPHWDDFPAAEGFPAAVVIGSLALPVTDLLGADDPPAEALTVPLALGLPAGALLLVRGQGAAALAIIHQAMLRLMVASGPGLIRFTLVDPRGLGEQFAPFLRLFGQDETLCGPKVWTTPSEISSRLAELCEHAEKIIQKYLRDEFADLDAYNRVAGDLAEPNQVVVVTDLPHGLGPDALERLAALMDYGPRCGIHVWVQTPSPADLPAEIGIERFRDGGLSLRLEGSAPVLDVPAPEAWTGRLDDVPSPERFPAVLDIVAARSLGQAVRAVPLSLGAPEEHWCRDSARELRIPIGRAGADRLQELVLGHGTAQHVLIGGRTGSGKSTLLHALVTNGALWYGPDQLAFWLVDFKKGVEFKRYASEKLPHAKVVAVESDREYGLSVLHHIDEELERRGTLFRRHGVQDLAGFRAAAPTEPMPRSVLVIDEFHEFFAEDDAIGRDAALLLERFVRQGRAFGIHVVLGSQSISGSLGLARSAIGQMGVRIALQCNEADSQLILSEENLAARLLERPGEAIYNARSGLPAGNEPCQVFWLDEGEQVDFLRQLATAAGADAPRPWVFEGNAPADFAANRSFAHLLAAGAGEERPALRGWIGEPNAIRDHVEAHLSDRAGANLLVVGPHREAMAGMALAFLASLALRYAPGALRLVVVDSADEDDRLRRRLVRFAAGVPHDVAVHGVADGVATIAAIGAEVADEAATPLPTVVVILGLGQMRSLRQADEFAFSSSSSTEPGPADRFLTLLAEGPDRGCHVVAWCESATAVRNSLQRAHLRTFDQRLLFQMSAGDSADLIEDSAASRLGLHHALLCDLEACRQVKFRPYLPLDDDACDDLAQRIANHWA